MQVFLCDDDMPGLELGDHSHMGELKADTVGDDVVYDSFVLVRSGDDLRSAMQLWVEPTQTQLAPALLYYGVIQQALLEALRATLKFDNCEGNKFANVVIFARVFCSLSRFFFCAILHAVYSYKP